MYLAPCPVEHCIVQSVDVQVVLRVFFASFPVSPAAETKTEPCLPARFCFFVVFRLDVHTDIPCAPDDVPQVAPLFAGAHPVYFFVVRCDGGGHEADAVDHAVARGEPRCRPSA